MQNKAHGIMFHHFHDDHKHIVGQGSISADTLDRMLDHYGKTHNLISAEEFYDKSVRNRLTENDVCLTFDDGLLCQYDVAYPVLKARGLTAFWFIYSSPLCGIIEKLEIYRHFRFSKFADVEEFYSAFFDLVSVINKDAMKAIEAFNPDDYLKDFPFYTPNDKRFRYIRDVVLGVEKYNALMDELIDLYNYNVTENSKLLWLNADHIKDLNQNGHIIGLHSHSHPTVMIKKDFDGQMDEYRRNQIKLEEITEKRAFAVSYPCNSYNSDTLNCMRNLGITIGFRANMADFCLEEPHLEYPREDHANIIRAMEE